MGDTITSAVTMINAGGRFPKKNSKAADAVAIATNNAITVTTIFPITCIDRLMPAPSAGSSIVTDQAGTLVGLNWPRCSGRIGAVSWSAGDRACTRPSTDPAALSAGAHALDEKLAKKMPKRMIGRTLTLSSRVRVLDELS